MKHTIYGAALAVAAVLIIASALAVSGRDVRENEMDKALNTAVEESLGHLKAEGGYGFRDYHELIADFNQTLLLHVSSDSDIKIDILAADLERGVLDVEIEAGYQTVDGKKGKSSCRKTVILEEYSNRTAYHTVTFLSEGRVHAKYSLYEGSVIVEPQEPEREGHEFLRWKKDGDGQILTPDMKLEGDAVFTAEFR